MGTIAGLVSTHNGSMVELDTGKNSYASNFDNELAKGGCLCSNVELKSEEHTGW